MKVQPYIEKLSRSRIYKEFKKQNSDAFLVAGFFVLDLELGRNIHQIDYYVPSKKKIAAFNLDGKINMQLLDGITERIPNSLDIRINTDLEALPGILEDEMKNRNITEEIKKIIAVIQNIEGRKIWNLNCVLSGMEILKAHVDDESKTVLKMEKTSFTDIMKKIPIEAIQNVKQEPSSDENPEEEIKKLEKLEEEIKKEKERLKKDSSKKSNKDK